MSGETNIDPISQVASAKYAVNNITVATVVKALTGRLVRVSVSVAGAAGTINDCATVGTVAAANQICAIPAAIGVTYLDWPCYVGITISPGAGQTVSVSYS